MSHEPSQDSERRNFRRTGLASQVEIELAPEPEGAFPSDSASGETVNVGLRGLLARVDVELHEGAPCIVRFLDPKSEGDWLEARGLVRSSRRGPEGVLVGIEFEDPVEAVRPPSGAELRKDADFSAMKVLVVDDEPTIVELLYRFLSRRGCRVNTATNGEEALALLRAEPHDVTVLDIRMPGLDGLQVLTAIHEEGLEAGRIWAMSGYATDNEAREALSLGAADFINKPLDLKYLEWSMQLYRAVS